MTADNNPATNGSVEHFPGSNPHPVMRLSDDGRLT